MAKATDKPKRYKSQDVQPEVNTFNQVIKSREFFKTATEDGFDCYIDNGVVMFMNNNINEVKDYVTNKKYTGSWGVTRERS